MAVVSHTLPVKLEVVWVFDLVHQLAEKQVHQLIEGVFPAGDVVLAQDSGELVVLFLLVAGGNGMQIRERIFVFADLVRLDIVLEEALGRVIELVGVAPDGISLPDLRNRPEPLEERIVGQVFVVVAMGDDMAGLV
jgi:hypothetical protein